MKHKVERGKKAYYTILISYLMVLIIPLVCGAFLHLYNKRTVTRQAEDMTDKMLFSIQKQMDSMMDSIWKTTTTAARMNSLQQVLRHDQTEIDKAYGMYCVGKDLQMFYDPDQTMKDIFVYFLDEDKIVSREGVMSLDLYAQMYFDPSVTSGFLRKELNAFRYRECVKVNNRHGKQDLLCLMNSPDAVRSSDPGYIIGAIVEYGTVADRISAARWLDDTIVLIQDDRGESLWSDEISQEEAENLIGIAGKQNLHEAVELGSDRFIVMSRESETTHWKYYMAVPERIIEKSARQVQKYYFLTLFICIITGLVIAQGLSRKHYHPVKVLTDLAARFRPQNEEKTESDGNYQWLQDQVDLFFKERIHDMEILKENRKELKNYYLLRLLENSYTRGLKENLRKCQVVFDFPYYMVVQFQTLKPVTDMQEQALLQFVLKNIFTELMEETGLFRVYMVHIGEHMAGIINLENWTDVDRVREIIHQTQEVLEDKFNHVVTALLGGCYSGQSEIFKSYEDIGEMDGYVSLMGDTVICYEDVKNLNQVYRYNAKLDQKLFNAVKTGNLENARKQLQMILEPYIAGEVSLNVYQCLSFDVFGIILKAADEGGYHQVAEETDILEQISHQVSIRQAAVIFDELIQKVCERIQEQQKSTSRDQTLVLKVQEYIMQNFKDPDLNVSQTGLYFHMTPSYLSAIYKKQTGRSLLEFINHARLEEAERLLETGMSVVEVAEKAGFRDSTYLIRVFKKEKGITPGQKMAK